MRFPVNDYKNRWNRTAGLKYGDKTSYGWHESDDLNRNEGGDSDLGQQTVAIAKGKIIDFHKHTTKPTFGNHYLQEIIGPWGTRYVHYAHLQDFWGAKGQLVEEGSSVGTVGKSGTDVSHLHFGIMKKLMPIDSIAKTKEQLENWEDPILFIETWLNYIVPPPVEEFPMREQFKLIFSILHSKPNPTEADIDMAVGSNLPPYEYGVQDLNNRVLPVTVEPYQLENLKLQQQLKEANDQISILQKQIDQGVEDPTPQPTPGDGGTGTGTTPPLDGGNSGSGDSAGFFEAIYVFLRKFFTGK